jgi:hypothetical protein
MPGASKYDGRPIQVMFEPGRSVVGNAGLLLTEVQYLKHGEEKNFAVVDAAMNDLMRPAMYEAWHGVKTVKENAGQPASMTWSARSANPATGWRARAKLAIHEGDLLALMSAGAYGMTMASNYNTRGRAAEVLVDGTQVHLVRRAKIRLTCLRWKRSSTDTVYCHLAKRQPRFRAAVSLLARRQRAWEADADIFCRAAFLFCLSEISAQIAIRPKTNAASKPPESAPARTGDQAAIMDVREHQGRREGGR